MRSVLMAIAVVGLVGCGSQVETTFETIPSDQAMQASASAPSPTPSTAGPGAVAYVVTGDYSATGELPFVPASSSLDQDGASSLVFCSGSCTYQDSSAFLFISFGSDEVRFENGEVQIQVACTFTFTRQNEIGAAGEFACTPDEAFGPGSGGVCGWTDHLDGSIAISRTDTCSPIGTATISGAFDAGGS